MVKSIYHQRGQSLFLEIKVHPQGGRNSVCLTKNGELKVTVTVAPEGGAANLAVIKVIGDWLDIKKSSINIVQGQSTRKKVICLPLEALEILNYQLSHFSMKP